MNLPTVWPINDVTAEIVSRLSGISSPVYKKKFRTQKYDVLFGCTCRLKAHFTGNPSRWISGGFHCDIIDGPHGILVFLSQQRLSSSL